MTDELLIGTRLARAQRGDEEAFTELTEPYRRELQLHCYRILGSLHDAEDLMQETMLAAWRGLERFEGRSSLRSWLYTIATNRCLNALRDGARRPVVVGEGVVAERFGDIPWLEPYPDALLEGIADGTPGPDAVYEAKESIALAFVAGLQHLAPRQRAVLVLRDVLGYRAAEVADMLGSTEPSVNSALQRARTVLEERVPARRESLSMPLTGAERQLVDRFAAALERDDIDDVVALLTDDAVVSMPPEPLWHQGREAIGEFLRERHAGRIGPWKFVAVSANGQPAFVYYMLEHGVFVRSGVFVVGVRGDGVTSVTRFHGHGLLWRFGVPETL
jgi:RNA polymerase sigma-70 factor (ECF subfamily)